MSAALARIPDPPWTLTAGRAAARAGEPVTLATLERWSPEERAEAYLWAVGFVQSARVEHLPATKGP